MKATHWITCSLFLLMACEGNNKKQEAEIKPNLEEQLLGTWSNVELKVTMKLDSADSVMIVAPGKWEEILKIKPIITEFKIDKTFASLYYSLEGELIMTSEGSWSIEGDSLTMVERGVSNTYMAKVENDIVTFEGYLDWDQDGEADDLYWGTQQREISN